MKIKPIIVQNILENLPTGLLVIDPDGEIVTINRAASEMLGYSLERFEGKGWGDIFFDDQNNTDLDQVIVDIIQERRVNLQRSVPYVRPDGKILQITITGSFLRENNEVVGMVVLLNNVTKLHRIHEIEKEVLEEKHRIQEERAEGLRRLAQAVSHQIRNPVTAIGGFAARMLKDLDEEDHDRVYLNGILEDAGRLEAIVRGVSEFARIPCPRLVKVDLAVVVEACWASILDKAPLCSRKVRWSMAIEPLEIAIDPGLFSEALVELLLNALEALEGDEGAIRVAAHEEGEGFDLEITDTGAGISEKDAPYIFDPFFTTKAVGVGMGLCKARRIIKEHKGEILVDSRPGKGTTVTVRLSDKDVRNHR